jgi:hypothetical protein
MLWLPDKPSPRRAACSRTMPISVSPLLTCAAALVRGVALG